MNTVVTHADLRRDIGLSQAEKAIVALANRCGRNSERPCRMMEDDGWEVKWTLGWVATAQRGKEYEEASGKTRKEAMMRLREATCPSLYSTSGSGSSCFDRMQTHP